MTTAEISTKQVCADCGYTDGEVEEVRNKVGIMVWACKDETECKARRDAIENELPAKINPLDDLMDKAAAGWKRYERLSKDRVSEYLKTGQILIEAKAMVKHGEWLGTLGAYGIPQSTAQRMVLLAETYGENNAGGVIEDGGITKAYEKASAENRPSKVSRENTQEGNLSNAEPVEPVEPVEEVEQVEQVEPVVKELSDVEEVEIIEQHDKQAITRSEDYEEGHKDGHAKGLREGYDKGLEDGRKEGYKEGRLSGDYGTGWTIGKESGRREGYDKGLKKGRKEAAAE